MLFIGPHVFVDQSGPAVSLGAAHGQAGIPSISSAFNSGLVDARVHLMVSFSYFKEYLLNLFKTGVTKFF